LQNKPFTSVDTICGHTNTVPIHIEVLLPAFVVGCILARPPGSDPHRDDAVEGSQMGPEIPGEQRVATLIAALFMCLVGLSLPPLAAETTATAAPGAVSAAQPPLPWGVASRRFEGAPMRERPRIQVALEQRPVESAPEMSVRIGERATAAARWT
jgi:hypothetical protein